MAVQKYNFPTTSTEADLNIMAAVYKGAEERGKKLDGAMPAYVAIASALVLVAIPGGGVPSVSFVPAAIGLVAGGWIWWSRRKERDAASMLQIYAQRWFNERGYQIRWGGHYEPISKAVD